MAERGVSICGSYYGHADACVFMRVCNGPGIGRALCGMITSNGSRGGRSNVIHTAAVAILIYNRSRHVAIADNKCGVCNCYWKAARA